MKYVSWNVNGLRAVMRKGFDQIYRSLDADVLCLQETKLSDYPEGTPLGDNIFHYWNNAERKGYSGTAIYTRHTPLSVNYGIGIEEHDHEGRVVTLEMTDFYLVCVYTPNSQEAETKGGKPRRLAYRMKWEDDFQAYLHALDEKKPVIVCGDMNVAHEEIDIKNPKTNHLSAGFTDEERGKMTTLLSNGFTDTFRALHPDDVTYSWWSYRFRSRERNTGWRIDYFLTSNRLRDRITDASIHNEIFGSDHCPIELDID